jgi:hypothetical protein
MKLNNYYFILLVFTITLLFFIFRNNIFTTFEGLRNKKKKKNKKNKILDTKGSLQIKRPKIGGSGKKKCRFIIVEIFIFIFRLIIGHSSPNYIFIKKYGRFSRIPSYAKAKEPSMRLLLLLKEDKNKEEKRGCFAEKNLSRIRYWRYAKRYAKYKNRK